MPSRDEHTAVIDNVSGHMIVFGGFCDGFRTNETAIYHIHQNSWVKAECQEGQPVPCARSGHSAVYYSGHMFVFGGKNDDSHKLDDLWTFNLGSQSW